MSEILTTAEETVLTADELENIASLITHSEAPDKTYKIGLHIADDEEMASYNKRYRGLNEPTDILSFVTLEFPPYSVPNWGEQTEHLVHCDIIIDIKQLYRQKGNRTIEEEFRIVFVHGLLHLVGFDHVRQRDAEIMKTKEQEYLKQIQGVV